MINCDNNRPLFILGNPNTGKTNLMVYLASLCTHKNRYILGYPGEIKGVKKIASMNDLQKIENCVLLIDEIDEFIPLYDKKSNAALRELIKFAEHNNIKLIANTQISQFIPRMMEAMVPQWAILELDIFSLKNGSKPKRVLFDFLTMPQTVNRHIGMKLSPGKFIWWNDQAEVGEVGEKEFPDMKIKKDWGKSAKKSAPKSAPRGE